ncbi:hypothetical protein PSENEW3n2_00005103 [Picochlorum sp. SENEW3]|nr:hypothetical protein PSENEW3n2_00005103 [Picochlorum sp. SENEW3]WPT17096.1 hypothetical protein PSENEW3_00005103 [Picochlorum sp. SENEW3]
MVMSKRVTNARSATHYKRTGPLKQKETYSFWDDAMSKMSTHPLLFAFIAIIMIFSGIASFLMHDRHSRSMFGGGDE